MTGGVFGCRRVYLVEAVGVEIYSGLADLRSAGSSADMQRARTCHMQETTM
jgi:hypothetical protein